MNVSERELFTFPRFAEAGLVTRGVQEVRRGFFRISVFDPGPHPGMVGVSGAHGELGRQPPFFPVRSNGSLQVIQARLVRLVGEGVEVQIAGEGIRRRIEPHRRARPRRDPEDLPVR